MDSRHFGSEREFTHAVIELAKELGWEEPFHIPARVYQNEWMPPGFPDLILRYRDNGGHCTMIAAELKTNDEERSVLSAKQRAFLEDFAHHMPAFVFRYRDWDYINRILREGPPQVTGQIIEPSLPVVRTEPWLPPDRSLSAVVGRLLDQICSPHYSRGDLANLRRIDPNHPDTEAFWRLVGQEHLIDYPLLEREWALVINGMALMSPHSHNGNTPVGRALFEGGDPSRNRAFYSALRLRKLLVAQGPNLWALLKNLFLTMNTVKQPFDWVEMTSFILNASNDPETAESGRLRDCQRLLWRGVSKCPWGQQLGRI